MDRVKRIWYLSPMRAAKVQASLRIRAVSPEPSLLAHTSSESRGTFRQKARSLAPLNGWACAVKICHDGMLEDTNSLDAAQMLTTEMKQTKLMNTNQCAEGFSNWCMKIIRCEIINAWWKVLLYGKHVAWIWCNRWGVWHCYSVPFQHFGNGGGVLWFGKICA